MKRRDFLKVIGLAAVSASFIDAFAQGAVAKPAKPNILFVISDDLCSALSGFGHPQCKTPNLDKLAGRGIRFDRAYCQWPVCGPSRASIMTGLHPAVLKMKNNRSLFRRTAPDVTTLPQLFMNNGYYAARVSKVYHMGIPGDILEGKAGPDDPASWNETVNIKAPEQNSTGQKEDLSPKVTSAGMDFVTVRVENDDSLQADKQAVDKALEMLPKLKDKPFFLGVGLVRPHVPLVAPDDLFDKYPAKDMPLPEVPKGDLDDVPRDARRNTNAVKYKMSREQQHKVLQGYYASVSYMDQQVGRLLEGLEEAGLADSTVVVFTSDHGYNLGQHTCWQKQSLFEDTVRVPLIISVPWLSNAGQRAEEIVELVDLYPTLADLAGLTAPNYLHGTSLRPLLESPDGIKWKKKAAYTTAPWNGRSIRTDQWRYTTWSNGKKGTELYDHKDDPGEFTNLAKKSEYKDTVRELQKQMDTLTKRSTALKY
ncbi:MAG: sulfatase [Planctomycetota bacterium]